MSHKIILFLGIGQSEKSALILKKNCAWLDEAIVPINYLTCRTAEEVERIALQHVKTVLEPYAGGGVTIIAESQSTVAVVKALHQMDIVPRALILLQPLGFNHKALGDSPANRYKEFLKRSRKFWRHKNQSMRFKGNRLTLYALMRQILPYASNLRLASSPGVNANLVPYASELANKFPVHIFASDQDSLFPYHEITKELPSKTSIQLRMLHGTHLNRATNRGIDQLHRVFETAIKR